MRTSALALTALLTATLVSKTQLAEAKKVPIDAFNVATEGAHSIDSTKALGALLWSVNADCSSLKSDLLQRQCEGVRNAGQAQFATQTYLIEASGDAIQLVTAADKKSVQITLNACISCEGSGVVVLGQGDHTVVGKRIEGVVLGTITKKFAKSADTAFWIKNLAHRLRVQFWVKLPVSPATPVSPAPPEHLKVAGRTALKVEVVGYRLFEPCKSEVLIAKPNSWQAPLSKGACTNTVKKPVIAKVPTIVDRLSASQIKGAMQVVKGQAEACHQIYGIEGKARYKMVIGGDGNLTEFKQLGDFVGTPTGICLDKAVSQVKFPKSKKKGTPISYPLILR